MHTQTYMYTHMCKDVCVVICTCLRVAISLIGIFDAKEWNIPDRAGHFKMKMNAFNAAIEKK